MSLPRLLWLDIETTGLDEKQDALLEVGCVVTDPQLRILDCSSRVFNLEPDTFLSQVILDMHGANGLLTEATMSLYHPSDPLHWDFLERLLDRWWKGDERAILAGRGVSSFDQRWLSVEAPNALFKRLHRYHVDLQTLQLVTLPGDQLPKQEFQPHRALYDCFAGIEWLKHLGTCYRLAVE